MSFPIHVCNIKRFIALSSVWSTQNAANVGKTISTRGRAGEVQPRIVSALPGVDIHIPVEPRATRTRSILKIAAVNAQASGRSANAKTALRLRARAYLDEVVEHKGGDAGATPLRVREEERDVRLVVLDVGHEEREADHKLPAHAQQTTNQGRFSPHNTPPIRNEGMCVSFHFKHQFEGMSRETTSGATYL